MTTHEAVEVANGLTSPFEIATSSARLRIAGVTVRVVGVPARPRHFALMADVPCRIGSAGDSDVVIAAPTVSRAHVEVVLTAGGVVVRDLGSRNGTFYLGQRVDRATLAIGASLVLGGVTVVVDEDVPSKAPCNYDADTYHAIFGRSSRMKCLFSLLTRVEPSLTPVLVQGETGVGKDMVARAIHERSRIAGQPFVALNCGALPRDLIGSELFGHRRGAFTGAIEPRKGAFESADRGTLFLDEVGELPIELQPMLLRALETGEVRPLGGDAPKCVRVRVIAATHRDLEEDVAQGRFREDLFYRLAVLRIAVPPLRERIDDIEPLAQRFAEDAGASQFLASPIIEQLKARPWSGNVRELRNAVQSYVALGTLPDRARARVPTLDLALRELVDPRRPYPEQKEALVDRFTAIYLEALLGAARGNQTLAARWAGLDRGYIGRLMAKHGFKK